MNNPDMAAMDYLSYPKRRIFYMDLPWSMLSYVPIHIARTNYKVNEVYGQWAEETYARQRRAWSPATGRTRTPWRK